MTIPAFVVGIIACACTSALAMWFGHKLGRTKERRIAPPIAEKLEVYRGSGHLEVDCRHCGQLNRVPWQNLRSQRPVCGKCKAKLMPRKSLSISVRAPWWDVAISNVRDDYEKTWDLVAGMFDQLNMIEFTTTPPSLNGPRRPAN